ncbi:MAG: M48 family metallopeptidase [Salinisphaeraceae bacterium]
MASMISLFVMTWVLLGWVVLVYLARRQARFLETARVPAMFADTVVPDQHARACAYGRARLLVRLADSGWSVLLAVVWTVGGGLAALAALMPAGWVGQMLLLAAFAGIHECLRAPPRLIQVFVVDARFGFNRMTPLLFARDALIKAALAAVLLGGGGLALLLPVMLIGPPGWGLSALAAVLAGGFLLWAQPRLIAPLFNRFEALEQGPLRERLEAMIERCGARAESMFVMDGSRRSALANAYFAGFGRAKRVVLFDTLIRELDDDEIEAVLAHELGHDREGHIRRHYARLGGLLMVGIVGLGAAGEWGWLGALGVPAMAGAWLAAGYLWLPLMAWPLQPWLAACLRRYEFEADAFAVRHADAGALVSALHKLLTRNAAALAADPLYAAFHASHPPPDQRLAALQQRPS